MTDTTPTPEAHDPQQGARGGVLGAFERFMERPATYWTLSLVCFACGVVGVVLALVDYDVLRDVVQVVDIRSVGAIGFIAVLGARKDSARWPIMLAGVGCLLSLILLGVGVVRWLTGA